MQVIRKICLLWVYLAGVLLGMIVFITVTDISLSVLKLGGIVGYEDFVRLAISCIALMFFPWTQFERGHVAVDFFADKLSTKAQILFDRVWLFITLILVGFLFVIMCFGLIEAKEDQIISSILGYKEWIFYIPGLISLVLWGVVLFWQIFIKKIEVSNG